MKYRNIPLASFIAALLLAIYFFYFKWSYSRFNSIDFESSVFYGDKYIFSPSDDEYLIFIYSSKTIDFLETTKLFDKYGLKVIAIDLYQNTKLKISNNIIPLSASINTLLNLIHVFNIREVPVSFKIKRKDGSLFIQNSSKYLYK